MSGIDYEELFQEGYLAYCTVLPTYDPRRSKLLTYLTTVLRRHYTNLYHHLNWGVTLIDREVEIDNTYWQPTYLHELLAYDYSKHALEMLRIISESSPKAIVEPSRFALKRFLKEGGFETSTVECTIEEIVFKVCRDLKGFGKKLTFN